MSAPQFTPGPWAVDPHRCKISIVNPAAVHAGSHGGGGKLIASTPVVKSSVQAPQALANARLIAAAPELYKCLALALGVINSSQIVWHGYGAASNALAKARGEQ
jgi:hypothetical protein